MVLFLSDDEEDIYEKILDVVKHSGMAEMDSIKAVFRHRRNILRQSGG